MKINEEKKDKIEIIKQQKVEIQKVLENTIIPNKGHTLFEVNLIENTIEKAVFDDLPNVKWEDALNGQISTKSIITKKDNCIYISALNKKNVIKILNKKNNESN